jgi:diguanylate cyclase (GGDEF)-like protein
MAPRENIFRRYAALSAANEKILRSTSESDLYNPVCDVVVAEGGFLCAVALLAEADASMRIVAESGVPSAGFQTRSFSFDPKSELGRVLSAAALRIGLPTTIKDCLRNTPLEFVQENAKRDDTLSAVAIPILSGGTSIGALLFGLNRQDALDEVSLSLLHRMAENISFALERQKLRQQADQASKRLARMFAALSATNEAIIRAKTRVELCELVCKATVLGGIFSTTTIAFAEPCGRFLRPVATNGSGPLAEFAMELRIPIEASRSEGSSLNEIAFKSKKACISNDYVNDARFAFLRQFVQKIGSGSVAAFPLIKDGHSIGVLSLHSRELNTFTPQLIDLLQRIADNVSFSLENFDRADAKAKADEQINYLATHDGLTGLPNRRMFSQLLNTFIETSRRYDRQFALLFIDLDRFKIINDTLGHANGDALLVEIAGRFRESVRASDVVARIGGDEFVIILPDTVEKEQVAEVARKLLSAATKPVLLSGQERCVSASIGVAMFPADGNDEQTLTKNADSAMYQVKDGGKNHVRFYSRDVVTPSAQQPEFASCA